MPSGKRLLVVGALVAASAFSAPAAWAQFASSIEGTVYKKH